MSVPEEEEEDSEDRTSGGSLPLIVFMVPGHGQSVSEIQPFSNNIAESLKKEGLKGRPAEVYIFDFLEQPTAFAGQMLQIQARYLQLGVFSILNRHPEHTPFILIGFDSGASVAYLTLAMTEFPSS